MSTAVSSGPRGTTSPPAEPDKPAEPSLSSALISLFKDTALAAGIGVPELTYGARWINVNTFQVLETWTVAAGLYLATCYVLAIALRLLERRYAHGTVRAYVCCVAHLAHWTCRRRIRARDLDDEVVEPAVADGRYLARI